ncbi:MAG: choice-of-anchor F family protein [Haliea sp.]|uniref:choice-of-anchor F family protein n=1 Tax=Haliea sp. TaxID=1932666 RepID=UPI0032EE85B7
MNKRKFTVKPPHHFLYSTLALAIAGLSAGSASAAPIDSWNLDNVGVVPNVVDGVSGGVSTIYDQAPVGSTAASSGYIKWEEPEGASPGLKVVNDAPAGDSGAQVDNCIMAAGAATCNGPFQSGKRFKLDRTAFDPIDLVFDLSTGSLTDGNDGLYRVFQKYGNNTGSALGGFNIGLGFGIGSDFIASSANDGLSFVNFGADPKGSEFSSVFAEGLFGEDEERDRLRGYFSGERSGFNLDWVNEDLFQTTGLFGGQYGYEALFGDWMSYSMAPDGYFYDDDGNPATDNVLMAHYDASLDKWIMNRAIDADGNIVPTAVGNEGVQYDSILDVENALKQQALVSGLVLATCPDVPVSGTACLAGTGEIEDLAKFNVTYFIDPVDFDSANQSTFTLRLSGSARAVPEPGALALFATGLGLLLGGRRRAGRSKTAAD